MCAIAGTVTGPSGVGAEESAARRWRSDIGDLGGPR